MTKQLLLNEIRERTLLGDGAMGTQLMIAGLAQGNCGEEWNLTHPERVLAIQRRYVEAGSDCIGINRIPCVNRFRVVAGLHLEQQPDRDENEAHCAIVPVLTLSRASYAPARSIG